MSEALLNGVLQGATYALLAIGYTLVFGVMRLLTLAHGQIFMASGLAALLLSGSGTPFWVAGLYAIAIGAGLSVLTDLLCFRTVGYTRPIPAAVATIGLGIVIHNSTLQFRGDSTPVVLPFEIPSLDFTVGGVLVSGVQVVGLALTAVVMVATHLFVTRTRWGVAMRAFSEDPAAVAVLGVPTRWLSAVTMGIAGALAGLASFLLILRIGSVSPFAGLGVGLIGLAVMTIGGLGSLPGAMVAGLLLGVLESVSSYAGFGGYQAAVPWLLLVAVLLVRPRGLLGVRTA